MATGTVKWFGDSRATRSSPLHWVRSPGTVEASNRGGHAIATQTDKVELQGGVVGVGRFGKVEITAADVEALSNVEQLVARGASRLTAERIVEIERGDDAPGRARPHTQARR